MATSARVVVHSGFQRLAPPTATANVLQVAVSADDLCIVANDQLNEVHCSPRGFTGSAPAWRQLRNAVSWISLSGDTLWAIGTGSDQRLVASRLSGAALSTPATPRTVSPVRRVASNATHVCIVAGVDSDALCSSIGADLALDERRRVRTDLKEVGVARSSVYGISQNGTIWFADARTLPSRREKLASIAADDAFVCVAEQTTRDVLCIAPSVDRWRRLKTSLWQLALVDSTLYGVAPNGTLWSTKLSIEEAVVDDESAAPPTDAAAGATTPASSTAPSVRDISQRSRSVAAGTSAVVVCIAVVVATAALLWLRMRRHHSRHSKTDASELTHQLVRTKDTAECSSGRGSNQRFMPTPASWDWIQDDVLLTNRLSRQELCLETVISHGAFGEVYRGVYLGHAVAVKRLLPEKARLMHEISAFAAEAKLMATLEHECIVRFIGVAWSKPSDLCVVTELMAGGDVRQLLQTHQSMGRPQGFSRDKLQIAVHVARALTYLHSLDPVLLHRDLKSKNILLTEDGDAKLTDFGVAREWEDLTMTEGVGSLLWMAPEIVHGERYDEKADIYSFGVVLSELDTNELPFSRMRRRHRANAAGDKQPNPQGDGDDRDGDAASGEWLSDLAICHLVSSGELSVSFSESCDTRIRSLGQECVCVDARHRPSATEVLHRLHQLWWEQ